MRHPVSRTLHAYWDGLRAGRTAPERGEIDPAAIRQILAYTFMLEIAAPPPVQPRDAAFRLVGTRIDALFGDLRRSSFEQVWQDGSMNAAALLLAGVLDDRSAVVASARGAPLGYGTTAFELLLLPLRHHGRTHARVLGSLAGTETPAWMGLRPAAPLELLAFRNVAPRQRRPDFGAADTLRPARAAPASLVPPLRHVGRFRVYDGGLGRGAPSATDA